MLRCTYLCTYAVHVEQTQTMLLQVEIVQYETCQFIYSTSMYGWLFYGSQCDLVR